MSSYNAGGLVFVPFLDLKSQYLQLKQEVSAAVDEVFSNTQFILGPQVGRFEGAYAKFLETNHVVGVANGTDSLVLSYQALGIGPGDEVIIPAHTFVATAIGVLNAGATPVLVDVHPDSYLIDHTKLEQALTPRTKAICPVHLYGRACDMDAIMGFAKKHSLCVVEDAAQSHGARWNGKVTGTFGECGSFSFYPGKNLGAYGDGGAVCTNSPEINSKLRRLRNYGSEIKYEHPERGTNSRLDSVQAAILDIKLKHLAGWNAQRHAAAVKYVERLQPLASRGLVLPDPRSASEHVFHLFVVQVDNRASVMEYLAKHDIQTGIHYPVPFYLQGGYTELGHKAGAFPVTEKLAARILSLPMFPEITDDQIDFVCETLAKAI
jgi:dTDP-4-amino-4,6-dideoxygalactose transaminase